MTEFSNNITINPDVCSGKPCIKGTRITVYDILEYLAGGMSINEILEDFPSLTDEVYTFFSSINRRQNISKMATTNVGFMLVQ